MSVILPIRSFYATKDQRKADKANKFIGRGSKASSTNAYREAFEQVNAANCGVYGPTDVVFISVEGNRRGRLRFDKDEVLKAVNAGATLITDSEAGRMRSYNIGERELAAFLTQCSHKEVEAGTWKPIGVLAI